MHDSKKDSSKNTLGNRLTDNNLGENSQTTDGTVDIAKLTGHVRDFHIMQSIDYEEDPFGEEALKKINFHNRGTYCPKKEFNSVVAA